MTKVVDARREAWALKKAVREGEEVKQVFQRKYAHGGVVAGRPVGHVVGTYKKGRMAAPWRAVVYLEVTNRAERGRPVKGEFDTAADAAHAVWEESR